MRKECFTVYCVFIYFSCIHFITVSYTTVIFSFNLSMYPSSILIWWFDFLNPPTLCLQLIHCLVDRIMEIIGCPFVAVGDDTGYYIKLSNVKHLFSPYFLPVCLLVVLGCGLLGGGGGLGFWKILVISCHLFSFIWSILLMALLGIYCRNPSFFQVDKLASFTEGST